MAAISRDAFHVAATESGDLSVVESYFAQPVTAAEVQRANAFFLGRAPVLNIFGDGPNDPWYFTSPPHDPWLVPGGSRQRSFVFSTAVSNGHVHVIEWFYAPARVASLGVTLAALLPFTGALAADENRVDVVELLLASEVFADLIDDHHKQQVLNQMLSVAVERSHSETIELLVAHGAHVNAESELGRDHPLASCAASGDEHSVRALVGNGAFVVGTHLLSHASYLGNVESARELLKHGVDWGNLTGDFNPLHAAAEEGYADLLQLYVEDGFADVDAQTSRGETALMMVTWQDSAERGAVCADAVEGVARILVELGADVRIQDAHGRTALHHAVGTEYTSVVDVLLEYGADPNQRTCAGESPLDLFPFSDLDEDAEYLVCQLDLLVRYGADLRATGPDSFSGEERLRLTIAGCNLLKSWEEREGSGEDSAGKTRRCTI